MKRLIEEAKQMIRINSVTSRGNEELANYVASLFSDRGFRTQLQQVSHSLDGVSKRQFNVIGIMGDPLVDRKIRKGLLLCTHIDTVGPGVLENWTQTLGDPFAAVVKDGVIFGLGAADSKLDLLCKIHAAGRLREKKIKNPLYLVGSCGQEMGMFGVKYLIKALTLNPKHVVVGATTGLELVHAHKAAAFYKVSIGFQQVERDARGFNRKVHLYTHGKSAHSAYPEAGKNAIFGMLDFLQRAADSGFEIRFTELKGGEDVNRVPDTALSKFFLTAHQLEDFKRFFREMARVEGNEKTFRVELGGAGETGVKFIPDGVFSCVSEVVGFFEKISEDLKRVKDASYYPDHSTINFGKLEQSNGLIHLHFDARLLPDLLIEEIETHIRDGIAKIAKGYLSLNLSVARERVIPGLDMPENHELIQICRDRLKSVGIEPALAKKSCSTEAALFSRAGFEALAFGPGEVVGNSHGPNERNLLEQLERATRFYEALIEQLCVAP